MGKAIENAIKLLAEKIIENFEEDSTYSVNAVDVLHLSQAALNLAQTAATVASTKKHLKERKHDR